MLKLYHLLIDIATLDLIYFFSYVGAGVATIAIEAGIFTITYFIVKKLNLPKTKSPPITVILAGPAEAYFSRSRRSKHASSPAN